MKNDRPSVLIPILLLVVFIICLAGVHEIVVNSAAAAEIKTVEKPLSAGEPKSSALQPPAVKPPVTVPLADSVSRNAVGCVFPLTGRFAEAGKKAVDAVLLAVKLYNQRSVSPCKIVVSDSGETPEGIKKAIAYLADEARVMAIVAVAGTAEASAAAIAAQKRQVPLVLIASKEGVTETGEYVFQHFLIPTQQIEALTKYAFDTLNVAIFSVLYPQDDYGEEMVRLFRREIKKAGGKIDQAIPYSKKQTDFTEQIKKLMGNKFGASEKVGAAGGESSSKSSMDFEALFIPDSPLRVKMIASQLAFYDVRAVKLMGTSLWHSSDLLKNGAEYLEGAVFADSFLVNGILPETNDFVDVYYSAYSREPDTIDALSYDTMGLVLGVLENGEIKTRAAFIKALSAVQGFRGVTGNISFHGTRVAQKDAFILKVQNGKIEQVR